MNRELVDKVVHAVLYKLHSLSLSRLVEDNHASVSLSDE